MKAKLEGFIFFFFSRESRFISIFSRILPTTGKRLMCRYGDGFSGSLPGSGIVTLTKGSSEITCFIAIHTFYSSK